MSDNQFTVGVGADGKIKLHYGGEAASVAFDLTPNQAMKLGSTLCSEAHHATN